MSSIANNLFETKKEPDDNLVLSSLKDELGPEEIEISSDYFFNSDLSLKNEDNFSNPFGVEVIQDIPAEIGHYNVGKKLSNDNYEPVEEKPFPQSSANYYLKSDCTALVNLVPQLTANQDSKSKNSGLSKLVSLELEKDIKSELDSSPKSNFVYNCIYCDECFISQSFLNVHIAEKHGICFDDENVPEETYKIERDNSNQKRGVIGDAEQPGSTSFSIDIGKKGKKSVKKKNISSKKAPYVCKVCNKIYSCRQSLRNHEKLHSERPLLQCSVCSAAFRTKDGYSHHMNIHRQDPVELPDEFEQMLHQCPYCPSRFTQSYLKTHIASHENQRLHKCTACSKKFNRKCELKQHLSIHENKHVCQICKKSCRTNSKLKEHMTIHDGQRPHKCPHCPSSYKRASHLKRHILNHKNERIHKCSFCEKSFVIVSDLNQHLKVHKGKHVCDYCKSAFRSKFDLNEHVARQHKIQSHQCPLCTAQFKIKRFLKLHLLSHENGKQYNCSLCSKSYREKRDLKRHLESHDPGLKFVCEQCGATFKKSKTFNAHKRTHLGMQIHKFECFHCKLKYKTKGELTKHIITKHVRKAHKGIHKNSIKERIARYECDSCKKSFFLKRKLSEHMKKKHSW